MNIRILIATVVVTLFVLCPQVHAQAEDDPEQAEATELEGTWEVVSETMSGVQENLRGRLCRFDGSRRYWGTAGHEHVDWGSGERFSLDPSTMPAEIDIEYSGRTTSGIYELDGNILRLCYSRGLKPDIGIRPGRFVSTADYPTALYVLRRVTEEDDE